MTANLNSIIYSALAGVITTYVAHHTGAQDIGVALLVIAAHLLHVPVTNGNNGTGTGFPNGSH